MNMYRLDKRHERNGITGKIVVTSYLNIPLFWLDSHPAEYHYKIEIAIKHQHGNTKHLLEYALFFRESDPFED